MTAWCQNLPFLVYVIRCNYSHMSASGQPGYMLMPVGQGMAAPPGYMLVPVMQPQANGEASSSSGSLISPLVHSSLFFQFTHLSTSSLISVLPVHSSLYFWFTHLSSFRHIHVTRVLLSLVFRVAGINDPTTGVPAHQGALQLIASVPAFSIHGMSL